MSNKIPLSTPFLIGNEWKYIKECLDTGWVSSAGKFVDKFEANISKFLDINHSIACVNGTSALQVALRVSGVSKGDEVLVPTITFIASVNSIIYLNASPIFIDCDEYYNLNVNKVLDFLSNETYMATNPLDNQKYCFNKRTNKKIKAIMPVHVFGHACDIYPLLDVCENKNIKIIEDAAESLGTMYSKGNLKNKYSGTVGDIGCFSFNGNKIITCGGGGMIVTNNEEVAKKCKYLTTQAKDDAIRFIHNEVGYNFRMTNIQAALGVAQLENLPKFIDIKKRNHALLYQAIDKIKGLKIISPPEYANSNYWFYALDIDEELYGANKENLMKYLNQNGVEARPLWLPNHLQEPFKEFQKGSIENAIRLHRRTLNIPCSTNLSEMEIEKIIKLLNSGAKNE